MSGKMLELSVDKFIFRFPEDLLYSDSGLWLRPEGGLVRVGLSDFTQQRNGDIAFVEVRSEGTILEAGEELAVVETIKVNLSIPSPLGGRIVEVNCALEGDPELVNLDPYLKGWLAVLEPSSWEDDKVDLKPAEAYVDLARAQAEREIRR